MRGEKRRGTARINGAFILELCDWIVSATLICFHPSSLAWEKETRGTKPKRNIRKGRKREDKEERDARSWKRITQKVEGGDGGERGHRRGRGERRGRGRDDENV